MCLMVWSRLLLKVMVNLYSAHMDPDDWQQPQQFRPERFLDQSGNVVDRDRVIAFSLGAFMSTFYSGTRPHLNLNLKIQAKFAGL